MQKNSIYLVILLLFAIGCTKDENINGTNNNSIVGSWLLTKITKIYSNGDTEYPTGELGRELTFNAEGSYSSNEDHEGNWSISGGVLTIVSTQDDVDQTEIPFEIEGNKLTLTVWYTGYRWIEEYTRK